jgi:hypothetical protein
MLAVVLIAAGVVIGTPAAADEDDLPILEGRESLGLVVVKASPHCPDPPEHLPVVDFRLELSAYEGELDPVTEEILASTELRIELTVLRNGFRGDGVQRFEFEPRMTEPSNGPPTGSEIATPSMTVRGLQPGVVHYARALAMVGDGWMPTRTTTFMTPICAVDGLDREEVTP